MNMNMWTTGNYATSSPDNLTGTRIREERLPATYYILDRHGAPIPTADPVMWQRWMSHARQRILKQDQLSDGTFVSTVFIGVATRETHALWQTAVFKPATDGHHTYDASSDRLYATREAAIAGHEAIVQLLRGGRAIRFREEP